MCVASVGVLCLLIFLDIFFLNINIFAMPKSIYKWTGLSDSISYTTFSISTDGEYSSTIHAFQLDPKKVRLDVLVAPNETEGALVDELAKANKANIVINGGFFTPDHKSIGLIIKDGKEINLIHKTSWWSIFAITPDGPKIYTPKEFVGVKNVKTALQVGPRLVVDGTYPKLKAGVAARSAVGITRDGKVIIAITQGVGVPFSDFAHKMGDDPAAGGLGCPNAMAFDGGGSSQLYAKLKKFELNVTGISRITNALAVFAK